VAHGCKSCRISPESQAPNRQPRHYNAGGASERVRACQRLAGGLAVAGRRLVCRTVTLIALVVNACAGISEIRPPGTRAVVPGGPLNMPMCCLIVSHE
jgi:hypothetical protein